MQDTFEELIHNMGGHLLGEKPGKDRDYGLLAPGEIIHEVGTTRRMGDDPRTSVTNKYQQLHDVDNVFIVDAGPFVSQADKNCTWTILALSWRASDYIVEQLKRQNIMIMDRRKSIQAMIPWGQCFRGSLSWCAGSKMRPQGNAQVRGRRTTLGVPPKSWIVWKS